MVPMTHLLCPSLRDSGSVNQQWLTVFAVEDLDNDLPPCRLSLFHQGLHLIRLTELPESIFHRLAGGMGWCTAWAAKPENDLVLFGLHLMPLLRPQ
jgi:hypothetical protein